MATRFLQPVDRRFLWLYVLARAALIGGLLIGLVFNLSQLEGKGWGERTVFYTAVAFILPLVWRLSGRRFAWSFLADGLLAAPFALDILGNLFGFYDSLSSFDDILHFSNWVLLVACFVVTVRRSSTISKLNLVALGTGFGATMIILWEFMEYLIMKAGTERLHLTYEDTIGDLCLSTLGGFVVSLVLGSLLRRQSSITRATP